MTVSIYSGSTTSGAPFETLTATVGVGGSYSVAVPTSMALAQGTYTAVASQSDRAYILGAQRCDHLYGGHDSTDDGEPHAADG